MLGSLLHLFAARLKIDPTVMSRPVMATLVDATGLFIYFTVARIVIGLQQRGSTMAKEVMFISSRLVGKSWPDFEQQVAEYLNQGWVVIGFSTERDPAQGDLVYVMLQRDVFDPQSGSQSALPEGPAE